MAKCDICGKSPRFGQNVSHAMNRTGRQFRPNIQRTTVTISGRKKQLRVCAKCLHSLDKLIASGKIPQ